MTYLVHTDPSDHSDRGLLVFVIFAILVITIHCLKK